MLALYNSVAASLAGNETAKMATKSVAMAATLAMCAVLAWMLFGIAQARILAPAPSPSPSPSFSTEPQPTAVFREYIGGGGAALTDVPIVDDSLPFHFILAFAVDESPAGHPTDGNFSAFWQPRLSPDAILAVKAAHPKVRFSLSLGGGGTVPIFQPTSTSSWLANASASLAGIIREYFLDGIDVDYETFANGVTPGQFADCLGPLVDGLKAEGFISTASIAPYPATDPFYTELWRRYNASFDYVNYQFYSEGDISASTYLSVFQEAQVVYGDGDKVLASFETLNNGTSILPASALQACQTLKDQGDLRGIFVWSADQSYSNFQFERQAQSLLLSS